MKGGSDITLRIGHPQISDWWAQVSWAGGLGLKAPQGAWVPHVSIFETWGFSVFRLTFTPDLSAAIYSCGKIEHGRNLPARSGRAPGRHLFRSTSSARKLPPCFRAR